MQHTSVVLLCLLLVLLRPQDSFSNTLFNSKTTCCYKFLNKLPSSFIQSYKVTGSSCSYQAVMFTLKRGKIYCALLTEKWVQDQLKKMAVLT